ncbi:hypothetical protein SK128_005688 [Halocaridina rubra]|uniref:Ionotropic glutamate receptor L-glutamate and glycine-binding domain-containing protein n=1 Tax=Halocaridina rubra TaxID=373956 RepID=A0AAN8WWH1_HALRR
MRVHHVIIFVLFPYLGKNKNLESGADLSNGSKNLLDVISERLAKSDAISINVLRGMPDKNTSEYSLYQEHFQEDHTNDCIYTENNSRDSIIHLKNETATCHNQTKDKVGRTFSPLRDSGANVHSIFGASDGTRAVGAMVWQMLETHVQGCHFVMVSQDTGNLLISYLIRLSVKVLQPHVVVDTTKLTGEDSEFLISNLLLGGNTTTCRTIFVDLTSGGQNSIFRLLAASKLWLWPDAWIVIVGNAEGVKLVLNDAALRNALRPLYLALPESLLKDLSNDNVFTALKVSKPRQINNDKLNEFKGIPNVYARCLYCKNGNPDIVLIFSWMLGEGTMPGLLDPFPNQLGQMEGHRIKFVGMSVFPFGNYVIELSDSKPRLILLDSLDKRMLETVSTKYNFTFDFNPPEDKQFGIPLGNGSWTGLVGAIQTGSADATTIIANNAERSQIFDHLRAYLADPIAVVSIKPHLLPQFTIVLRPFTENVWMYLFVSVILWGAVFWVVQKISFAFTGYSISPVDSVLYGWSILIQNAPSRTPSNASAQVMLGFWLLACIAITTAYTSSLVSHLTVQTITKPINSWEELPGIPDWKWGLEEKLFKSTVFTYLKESDNPNIKIVFQHMESVNVSEGLRRVSEGGFSLFIQYITIDSIIASYYTDDYGRNPYYVGVKGQIFTTDFGWGIRKGAPYRDSIQDVMNRMLESGITNYWTKIITSSRVSVNRRTASPEQQMWRNGNVFEQQSIPDDEKKTVLRLKHMMGVFITLLLGYIIAFIVFLKEKMFYQ